MPVLRFIASLFLLAAVVTLVRDASPWLAGVGPLEMKSLTQHWAELSPRTLAALRGGLGAGLWDFAAAPLLRLPTALSLAAIGVATGWLGRRRQKINVFAN